MRTRRPALRFPRHALEALIGGPIPWPLVHGDDPVHADDTTSPADDTTPTTESITTEPTHPTNSTPQLFTT